MILDTCELYWRKENISKILETFQNIRNDVGITLENHIHKLKTKFTKYSNNEELEFYIKALEVVLSHLQEFQTIGPTDYSLTVLKNISNTDIQTFENQTIISSINVILKSAALRFWQNNELFVQGNLEDCSLYYDTYITGNQNLLLTVQKLQMKLKDKNIIYSSNDLNSTTANVENNESITTVQPLFTLDLKFLVNEPYSAILTGHVQNLVYVFFEKDLQDILAYFSDGILDVVIVKSYEVARDLTLSSRSLFHTDFSNINVILSEDKKLIPQIKTLNLLEDKASFNSCINLKLSYLSLYNAYSARPVNENDHLTTSIVPCFFISLEDLSAEMMKGENYPSFTDEVAGNILEPLTLKGKIRSGNPLLIDMNLSSIDINLTCEQLTLLLDILNENFGGLGYSPGEIQLKPNVSNLSDAESLLKLEPSQISLRMTLDYLYLKAYTSKMRALAYSYIKTIFVACDVSMTPLYMTYKFALLGNKIIINDTREETKHIYKRFLECFPLHEEDFNQNHEVVHVTHANYKVLNHELTSSEIMWMRPGIEIKKLDTELTQIDEESDNPPWKTESVSNSAFIHCISIMMSSNLKTVKLNIELFNSTLFVYTIGMLDLLDWILTSYGSSTIARYQRPVSKIAVSHNQSHLSYESIQEKISVLMPTFKEFQLKIHIFRGIFNFFSRITGKKEPIIQLSSDLRVEASFAEWISYYHVIELKDCSIRRTEITPLLLNTHFENDIVSQLSPLFVCKSYVTICDNFYMMGKGAIKTLYNKEIGSIAPDIQSFLDKAFKDAEFGIPNVEYYPEKEPQTSLSHIQLSFNISKFKLAVSTRDMVVIMSTIFSLHSDYPSVSLNIAPSRCYQPNEIDKQPMKPIYYCKSFSTNCLTSFLYGKENEVSTIQTHVDRYYDLSTSVEEMNIILLDDTLPTLKPIFKISTSLNNSKVIWRPEAKNLIKVNELELWIDYISSQSGTWSPCLEKFAISFDFQNRPISNIKNDYQKKHTKHFSQTKAAGSAESTAEKLITERFNDWCDFEGHTCFNLHSGTPLWLNATPQFCQLLLWVIPTFLEYYRATSLARDDKILDIPLTKPVKIEKNCLSVPFEDICNIPIPDSSNESTTISYVNLTDRVYYAFGVLPKNNFQCSCVFKLIPTNQFRQLDSLVLSQEIELDDRTKEQKNIFTYLIPQVPPNIVDRLHEKYSVFSRDAIERRMMEIRDEKQCQYSLQNKIKYASNENSAKTLSPPFIGPFPKLAQVAAVSILRNSATMLPFPIETKPYKQANSQSNHKTEEQVRNQKERDDFNSLTIPIIATVISYQSTQHICVISTNGRIRNLSGLTLEVGFLDEEDKFMYLRNTSLCIIERKFLENNINYNDKSDNNKTFYPEYIKNRFYYKEYETQPVTNCLKWQNKHSSGYTLFLEHNHILSVPLSAYVAESCFKIVFRPAFLSEEEFLNGRNFEEQPKFDPLRWTAPIESSQKFVKLSNITRSCTNQLMSCSLRSLTDESLYFHIVRRDKTSLLPADYNFVTFTIYPSFSLVNACMIPMNLKMQMNSHQQQSDQISQTLSATGLYKSLSNQSLSAMSSPKNTILSEFTLEQNSYCYLYYMPIVSPSISLSMKIRNSVFDKWSSTIRINPFTNRKENVSHILTQSNNYAEFEVEAYQDPTIYAPYTHFLESYQCCCLLSIPRYLINRTTFRIKVCQPIGNNLEFKSFNGITPLSELDQTNLLVAFTELKDEKSKEKITVQKIVEIPVANGSTEFSISTNSKYHTFVLQTDRISPLDSVGVSSRCVSLLPQFLLCNKLDHTIRIRQHDVKSHIYHLVPHDKTIPIHWLMQKELLAFEFFVENVPGFTWSGPIFPSESFVGNTHIAVLNTQENMPYIFNVKISTHRSVVLTTIESVQQSTGQPYTKVLMKNCLSDMDIRLKTWHSTDIKEMERKSKNLNIIYKIKFNSEKLIAWPCPFTENRFSVSLLFFQENKQLNIHRSFTFNPRMRQKYFFQPQGDPEYQSSIGCYLLMEGTNIVIAVCKMAKIENSITSHSEIASNFTNAVISPHRQITVQLAAIGISIISDKKQQELFYTEIKQLCVVFLEKNDSQLIQLRIADIEIDCQLRDMNYPIILTNRGTSSFNSPSMSCWEFIPTLSHLIEIYHSHKPKESKKQIFSSHDAPDLQLFEYLDKEQSRPDSLYVWIERHSISSYDLHFKKVFIVLDDFELEFDAQVLNEATGFMKECFQNYDFLSSSDIPKSQIIDLALKPLHTNYEFKQPSQAIVLNELQIETFKTIIWCRLDLDDVPNLSDLIKIGLRILMISKTLELKGAPITFFKEVIKTPMRFRAETLLHTLKTRYQSQIIQSIGIVLGYSSLTKIPRAPIDLVRGTVGVGLTVADNISSGLSAVLSTLTFDSDYINQRQKTVKAPINVKEGLSAASKDLKEGFRHLGDIVTKPFGGAQKEGFSGFMKGLGKGFVGTLVKPVDKLGQVVSSVAVGLRAEYVEKPNESSKCKKRRARKPRMLWAYPAQIRVYDAYEAELCEKLGGDLAKDLVKAINVGVVNEPYLHHYVLLFHPKTISLVNLNFDSKFETTNSRIKAKIMWTISINNIVSLRASTHGVLIQLLDSFRQVPCLNATKISQIYKEINNSRRLIQNTIQLKDLKSWIEFTSSA